ncbi:MAG: hypothetical protein A2X80_00665 [Geobacteraceae bacterium GWB2_52_12]|nr:MAG: hypothetical protein A2X80_00665 [Geobacteraceae bacterium GWB2_52_12]
MKEFKDLSVLYVEDDSHHRGWFADTMKDNFAELRTAESGERALEIYLERPCDLLITDLVMPGMDGLALCRAIRAWSIDMPIVITSAALSRNMLFESVNIGVDGYILKPIEMEMVKSVLTQATNRLRLRQQSMKAARLWQQTFDAVPDMVAVLDRNFKVLRLNSAAVNLIGMKEKEALGQGYCTLIQQEREPKCCDVFKNAIDNGIGYSSEMPFEMLGGYYHVTVSPMRDMEGEIIGAVHVARDVTELKRAEDILLYTSNHDTLTGLYNRAWFETEFDRLSRGRTSPISVLMADLDRLKQVNDSIGHKAGDDLLRRAAELLVSCCRADDGIARIGGDEFSVLLPGVAESDAEELVARIRQKMEKDRQELGDNAVSLSLGMATVANVAELSEALMLADKRMYEDKAKRR